MYTEDVRDVVAGMGELLPKPAGYRLLIACPKVEEKTKGGIYIPDDLKKKEEHASIVGYVVAMGADAYMDPKRYPDGPWCKEGDWVLFRAYSGTRFNVNDVEFRVINDDTVEAVTANPNAIKRTGAA